MSGWDRRLCLNVRESMGIALDAGHVDGVGNILSVGCGVDVEGLCCFEYSGEWSITKYSCFRNISRTRTLSVV